MSDEPHDCHCWLVINQEDWYIGQIETVWSEQKQRFIRWMRLWRDEDTLDGARRPNFQVAFTSLDMSRVDWKAYCAMAQEMLKEQMEAQCRPSGITPKTVLITSPSTKRLN